MMKLYFIVFYSIFIVQIYGNLDLDEKHEKLQSLQTDKNVIPLTYENFVQIIKTPPRNFSTIIMFTVLSEKRQCEICSELLTIYELIARSAYHQQFDKRIYFTYVDYDRDVLTQRIFEFFNVNTVPAFVHVSSDQIQSNDKFNDVPLLENLVRWINSRTNLHINVLKAPDYAVFAFGSALFGFLSICVYIRRSVLDFLFHRRFWAFASVIFCLFMTSGQMWNQIRGPPMMHQNSYIHGSSQGQFIIETYIVFALNAAIVFGMIMLIEVAKDDTEVLNKTSSSILGLILFYVLFSYLLSIFKAKIGSYPYRLF